MIYNGFWNKERIPDTVERLINAASKRDVKLIPLPNCEAISELGFGVRVSGFDECDYALFWDKDIRLARALEAIGVRIYNSSDTIAVCDDKAATHLKLAAEGIRMPRTLVAPMTYQHMDEQPSQTFLKLAEKRLGFPMVVKECYGSLGGQVYIAYNGDELRALIRRMAARPFICQQYIASSAGSDIRIYVVDGKPIAAMRRQSKSDFRANIGCGGIAQAYKPTDEENEMAVTCCKILGAQFAGVDLLTDEPGRPLLCEVNSNAHVTAIMQCTGIDVAGAIVDSVLAKEGSVK